MNNKHWCNGFNHLKQKHGLWEYRYTSEDVNRGYYVNDKREGRWTWGFSYGEVLTSINNFANDEIEGEVIYIKK
jgi:hypothetical protein